MLPPWAPAGPQRPPHGSHPIAVHIERGGHTKGRSPRGRGTRGGRGLGIKLFCSGKCALFCLGGVESPTGGWAKAAPDPGAARPPQITPHFQKSPLFRAAAVGAAYRKLGGEEPLEKGDGDWGAALWPQGPPGRRLRLGGGPLRGSQRRELLDLLAHHFHHGCGGRERGWGVGFFGGGGCWGAPQEEAGAYPASWRVSPAAPAGSSPSAWLKSRFSA